MIVSAILIELSYKLGSPHINNPTLSFLPLKLTIVFFHIAATAECHCFTDKEYSFLVSLRGSSNSIILYFVLVINALQISNLIFKRSKVSEFFLGISIRSILFRVLTASKVR